MNIYLELFLIFLKIGAFTIGGGMAMLPLIVNATVSRGWISTELLYDFIAVAESTPGPFAVNVATYIGYEVGGIFGAICAVAGFFVPSFVIIFLIFKLGAKALQSKPVGFAFEGLRPAVIGLIGSAVITVAASVFYNSGQSGFNAVNYAGIILSVLLFLMMNKFKKLHPIFFIVISAGLGMAIYSVLGGI